MRRRFAREPGLVRRVSEGGRRKAGATDAETRRRGDGERSEVRDQIRGQILAEIRDQRSDVRDQRSESRGQRSEIRSEVRFWQRSEIRGQTSEIREQRAEVRGQRSEVRGQRSEGRDQRSERKEIVSETQFNAKRFVSARSGDAPGANRILVCLSPGVEVDRHLGV